jgi:hypothetical protein
MTSTSAAHAVAPSSAPHARFVSSHKPSANDVKWGKVPLWMKRTIAAINKAEDKAESKALREAFKIDLAESRKRSTAFLERLKAGLPPLPEDEDRPAYYANVKAHDPIKKVFDYGFCDHWGTLKEHGEEAFVTHPYLSDSHIEELKEFCARTGFVYEVGGVNYYHLLNKHVTSTTRITIRRGLN